MQYRIVKSDLGHLNELPEIEFVDSLEEGVEILRKLAQQDRYQSAWFPIPGLYGYASVEFLDTDGEWTMHVPEGH